jgi:HAMP domain-containing protein
MVITMIKAWGQVRWKMFAIIAFTATSTFLMGCLAVAVMNVVIRRESANVVKKQIEMLVDETDSRLVVDQGQIEIRRGAVSIPLGPELAARLSAVSDLKVTPISPKPFRVHSVNRQLVRTIERNFIPWATEPTGVVLTVYNLQTGAVEDWIAYTVRTTYAKTFHDLAQLGSQRANWVWLLAALAFMVLLLEAVGAWICFRLGSDIASSIDDLSHAARQIARGNFAWRTPERGGQLGDLVQSFNQMSVSLERLRREEAELQVAHTVQDYLFPRVMPAIPGVTVSGQTVAARMIGGDLYDCFSLGETKIGILCADVSGKGIPAALMMANLQALARARLSGAPPAEFVSLLNRQLAGKFGDNRYATLFWGEYNTATAVLTYVNAGNPAPILLHSAGEIERLEADGFPVGMFANARYAAKSISLFRGSRLVIFTDGLTDAQNAAKEEFGEDRLIERCRSAADANGFIETVAEWSAGTEQFDDTTVIVVDIGSQWTRNDASSSRGACSSGESLSRRG